VADERRVCRLEDLIKLMHHNFFTGNATMLLSRNAVVDVRPSLGPSRQ
jgi:hypothetical protein